MPDMGMAPDPDRAVALWMDMIEGRLRADQILVITDEVGKVLFVTAR